MTRHTPSTGGKTALVLAGGGVVGAVYELGALQALEELLAPSGCTANDFDIYVGTSAGAIVTSLLANGLTTATLMHVMADQHPAVRAPRPGDVFRWNGRGLARWALNLPGQLGRAAARSLRQRDLAPLLVALCEATPPGLYDVRSLADYFRQAYLGLGGSDQFDDLARDLFLVATSLNTGRRAVFGRGYAPGVAISQAVAASCALPLLYTPVRVGEEWYTDGGVRGNASLDVAIEHGARLVICINPLVPVTDACQPQDPTADVATRVMRITGHAGLHYHLKHLRHQYPEVDIVLIEPRLDDSEFVGQHLMDFSARDAMLQHGRRAVRQQLAEDYPHLAAVFSRHGLAVRPPAGAAAAERDTAARPGTTSAQPALAPAVDWPSRAQAGHTSQPAHSQARPPQPLEREPALPANERKKWAWPK